MVLFNISHLIGITNGGIRRIVRRAPLQIIVCKCHSRLIIDPEQPSTSNQDILLQNIRSANEVTDILYIIKKHHPIMNNQHLMQAFRTILSLQKSDRSTMSNGEVIRSNDFRVLCQTLKTQVRSLDIAETVDALKTLSFLGVPASSKIVQILLQIVTKQINVLSLQQIIFVDFLIKDFVASPLVEALKIALPIVFEAHLRMKVNSENVSQITDLLHYASRKNMSVSTTDILIENLMKNRSDVNFKNAKSIIRSICDLRTTDESHRPLLHHAIDVILENRTKCTYNDIDNLLSKLAIKFSNRNYYFFHEEFLEYASHYLIKNENSFEESVWILRKLIKFNYVNLQLLHYLSKKAEMNPHTLETCGTVILFSLVSGFAQADYRPENWNILEPKILTNARNHLVQVELPWIKFVRDLCTLECWPFDIFEKVFDEDFLAKYLAREYNMLDYLQLLALNQAITLLCPWYSGPKPPQNLLNKAIDFNGTNVQEYPLKQFLIKGFGGEQYVLDGVYTRLGHFIDHVIVLRKGEFPITLSQNKNSASRILMEDLPSSDDVKIIAVLCIPASSYCVNTRKLKGPIRQWLSSLEVLEPIVVPISIISWEELLEQEKLPYLMQKIKENVKC